MTIAVVWDVKQQTKKKYENIYCGAYWSGLSTVSQVTNKNFEHKIVNICLTISSNICFVYLKGPSH